MKCRFWKFFRMFFIISNSDFILITTKVIRYAFHFQINDLHGILERLRNNQFPVMQQLYL